MLFWVLPIPRRKRPDFARNIFLFLLRVLIVLACTGFVGWEAKRCLMRFLANQVSERVASLTPQEALFVFPAMTICPNFNSAYNVTALREYGMSAESYRWNGTFFGNSEDRSAAAGAAIYEAVTHDLAELVEHVYMYTSSPERPRLDFPPDNERLNRSMLGSTSWDTKWHDTYGKCYSLNLSSYASSAGIETVTIKTRLDSYIFLHYPGQFMDFDSTSRGHAFVGHKYYVNVDYTINVDAMGAESKMPCNFSLVGHYDDCAYEMLRSRQLQKFNCTVPWVPDPVVCNWTTPSITDVVTESRDTQRILMREFCPIPCAMLDFTFGWADTANLNKRPDQGYLRMYFRSSVQMNLSLLEYTELSMIAEIGGFVGLFLGLAVVDVRLLIGR